MNMILDLRSIRKEHGLKQLDLAERLGVSCSYLAKIERGLVHIDDLLYQRIARVFNVPSVKELIQRTRPREFGEGYVTSRPVSASMQRRRVDASPGLMPIVDLFCGIGGFSSGFEHNGSFEVVAGVDLLSDRLHTFSANHASANTYGQDIRDLTAEALMENTPIPKVIVGGPPCQGFSSLRPFRNIEANDPRNNLVEEFFRIVGRLMPEWIVFENVVGLLTHQAGRTFEAIFDAFEALGYRVEARVLNAAHYGVPQRRERLILVGSRKGKPFKWPAPTHVLLNERSMAGKHRRITSHRITSKTPALAPAVTLNDAIHDLPLLASGQRATKYRSDVTTTPYERFIRNNCEDLTLHESTKHSEKMLEIIRHSGANINALPPGLVTSGFSSCYSRLSANEPSVTLTVNFVHPASNRCIHPTQDRALTPREGARIQGFFDTFKFCGTRAQTVKQIGNAVPPPLGKIIADAILESD